MATGSKAMRWVKMLAAGGIVVVGGPALVYYITPTEEELFKRYNPDLQKKSLANRYERQKEFDDFVTQLKEYSKSDKPIWIVEEEHRRKAKDARLAEDAQKLEDAKARKAAMRKESGLE